MPGPSSTVAAQSQNFGASTNIISGIQGVSPGGNATVNMPVNQRIHRETFQCRGYGYRRSNSIAPIVFTPAVAGTETFGNPTFSNGQLATLGITNAASAKGNGTYNGVITPVPYAAKNGSNWSPTGAAFTYVVASNVVTSVTVTAGGDINDIPPELFMDSVKHLVNGIVMRDIGPDKVVKIAVANQPQASWPEAGEFPVFFTEPWRKIVDHDQATAWDLIGQSTYQIIMKINAEIGAPDLQGVYEFDYLRNARRGDKGQPVLFLRPIKQHTFTYNVPAGLFNVTSLPVDFPIQRMWLDDAAGVGGVTHVELYQDGNKVLEGTYKQVNQELRQYGFYPTVFSFSAVFDMDQRLGKALKVDDLIFRVYSSAPGALEITMEIQGDGYN